MIFFFKNNSLSFGWWWNHFFSIFIIHDPLSNLHRLIFLWGNILNTFIFITFFGHLDGETLHLERSLIGFISFLLFNLDTLLWVTLLHLNALIMPWDSGDLIWAIYICRFKHEVLASNWFFLLNTLISQADWSCGYALIDNCGWFHFYALISNWYLSCWYTLIDDRGRFHFNTLIFQGGFFGCHAWCILHTLI